MSEYLLTDTWRSRHENKSEYSWIKNYEDHNCKASRIDLALTSPEVTQLVFDVFFKIGIQTDHRALVLIIQINDNERGPGFWKLNSALLENPEFVTTIRNEIIRDLNALQQKSSIDRWEILKKRIRSSVNRFARREASQKKLVIAQLHEIINELESQVPLSIDNCELLHKSKLDLQELLNERIQGVIFRSRAKWYAEGDRSSKYFFNLEKNRSKEKSCLQLVNEEGQIITNVHKILEEQRKFYQTLYKCNTEVEFNLQKYF